MRFCSTILIRHRPQATTLAALDLTYPVVTDRSRSQLALEREHLAASDEETPVTPVDA